jgi:hypothetical protein
MLYARNRVFACLHCIDARLGSVSAAPQEKADAEMNRIVDEGFNHSQIEETVVYLADQIGSRLTNSPGMREAEDWTASRLKTLGLPTVRREAVAFGRGWSIRSLQVTMVTPRALALTAIPIAWTPGTNGTISAPVIVAPMETESDLEGWRGKLAGKIVLISPPGSVAELTRPTFERWTVVIGCHAVGDFGHGSGPSINIYKVRSSYVLQPGNALSIEFFASTEVPEWSGRRVDIGLEDDALLTQDGIRWAYPPIDRVLLIN